MRRPSIVPCLALLAACNAADGSLPSTTVTDDGSVTVVENRGASWAHGEAWTVAEAPALVIGVLEGDADYQLYQVLEARRRSDGGVVILDGSQSVRHYDSEGRFVATYGGPGTGPGEFGTPMYLLVRPDDSMVVWDSKGFRTTVLGSEGELISTESMDVEALARAVEPPLYPAVAEPLAGGRALLRLVGKPPEPRTGGPFRERTGVLLVLPDGTIDTVAFFADTEQSTIPGFGVPVVPAGARSTSVTADPSRERVCIGERERPEITCHGPDETRLTFNWPAEPVSVTESDIDEWIADTTDSWGPKMSAAEAEKALVDVVHPEFHPAHGSVEIDRAGRLWVEPTRRDRSARGGPMKVFDPDGVLLGEVVLPPIDVLEIGDDYLIGLYRDELDVEYVQVYELRKPTS